MLLLQDKVYRDTVVADIIEKLEKLTQTDTFIVTKIAHITVKLLIADITIDPKKITYYACLIATYYDTIVRFALDDDKECLFDNDFVKHLMKHDFTQKDICIYGAGLMTCVTASLQSQDDKITSNFYLTEKGVRGTFAYAIDNNNAGLFSIKVQPFITANNLVVSRFLLFEKESISLERKQELFDNGIPIYNLHHGDEKLRGGRCKSISHKSFKQDMPFFDKKWDTEYAKKQQREKIQKEQEKIQKEQERKEKKEREREEQRNLAIKRREEENALRLARASLVEAVAKVDEELEKIKRLKELNREVALKNQKLAEQKEAERIAKDAEKRHAEKIKQKELERQQKFASKKH